MKVYFTVDENGFVNNGWSSTPSFAEGEIELELDKEHEFFKSDYQCWKYENGELVFDEEKRQRLIEEYEREQNKPSELDTLALAIMELGKLILNGGK